jgi:hypothetical protein
MPIHICIQNGANVQVTPRVTLRQVQIFMCGTRHKVMGVNKKNYLNHYQI